MWVFDASCRNAKMNCIDDYDDVLGLKGVLKGLQDLPGKALLHLRPAAIIIDNPVELGQANYPSAGIVPDVSMAKYWEKVVLAS